MKAWPWIPGVPAAGHVTSGGHWHPGSIASCSKCPDDVKFAAIARAYARSSGVLWHPDSPGVKIRVRPSLLRRLGIVRSEFATLGESCQRDREFVSGLPWL